MTDRPPIDVSEERDLREDERALVRWLLEHGLPGAEQYLSQVDRVRVVSRCGCGCASVFLSCGNLGWPERGGLKQLSDYYWKTAAGHIFGVFVFAKNETLAELEVYSVDGLATADRLPMIEDLQNHYEFWSRPAPTP